MCNHSGHVTLAPNANSERRPRLCAPLLQELQEKAEKQRKRLINTKSFPEESCRECGILSRYRNAAVASRVDRAARYPHLGAPGARIADEVCPRRLGAGHRLEHGLPNGVSLGRLLFLRKAHLAGSLIAIVPGQIHPSGSAGVGFHPALGFSIARLSQSSTSRS